MSIKEEKLERRYEVLKLSNPTKQVDCIVLEFDDLIAREAIRAWAQAMLDAGFEGVYRDVMEKLEQTRIDFNNGYCAFCDEPIDKDFYVGDTACCSPECVDSYIAER